MSMCLLTGDTSLDDLDKVVSARCLPWQVTILLSFQYLSMNLACNSYYQGALMLIFLFPLFLLYQADCRYISGSVPDHWDKANVKESRTFFGFPVLVKVMFT